MVIFTAAGREISLVGWQPLHLVCMLALIATACGMLCLIVHMQWLYHAIAHPPPVRGVVYWKEVMRGMIAEWKRIVVYEKAQ